MDDDKKTKVRLIKELESLRQNVETLKQEQGLKSRPEAEKAELEHFLRERVKELSCLYGMAEIIEKNKSSLAKILHGIVNLIPPSWQYPEITAARIIFDKTRYISKDFKTSQWKQVADINVYNKRHGSVEVFYLKKCPDSFEGPFLKEERLLINAISERIGRVAERIRTEQELETERLALKNMNIALKEVLTKIEDEKDEIGKSLQHNVNKIIMPIVYALENDIPPQNKGYVNLLKQFLDEITSPYISKLSNIFSNLTLTEIQICNMIKSGLSTKEVAKLRGVSFSTISRHRENIRNKMGIKNKDINLHSYLQTDFSGTI